MKVKDFERAVALSKAREHLLSHRAMLTKAEMAEGSLGLNELNNRYSIGLSPDVGLANHVYINTTLDERKRFQAVAMDAVQRQLGEVEMELTKIGVEIE